MNEQFNRSVVADMKKMWGGKLRTWDDFKIASKKGRVRANKCVAAQVTSMGAVPKQYCIIYGIITLWPGFLIFPATTIAWFFLDFSAWWILGSMFAASFLIKLSRSGHCEGMIHSAEVNEKLYETLINNGAFMFGPETTN
jgi:hypothetical protein